MDRFQRLSGAHMEAVQREDATEHQHSNVLFPLKHEDATQPNFQPLKEEHIAGGYNVSDNLQL